LTVEEDFEDAPVKRIDSVIIDPGARITSSNTPGLTMSPVFLVPISWTRRSLRIEFGRADFPTRQTVKQLFNLADPTIEPPAEAETPVVSFKIQDDMGSIEQFVLGVSDGTCGRIP
jgi:hypothetical protein